MTLEWKDGYLTGVRKVDEQHMKLFASLNDLEKLINRDTVTRSEISDMIDALIAHVQVHFSFEEGCMMRYDCPMAKKNKDEHDQLLSLCRDFRYGSKKRKPSTPLLAEFHKSAENWVIEHIAFVDIHLRSCIRKKGD